MGELETTIRESRRAAALAAVKTPSPTSGGRRGSTPTSGGRRGSANGGSVRSPVSFRGLDPIRAVDLEHLDDGAPQTPFAPTVTYPIMKTIRPINCSARDLSPSSSSASSDAADYAAADDDEDDDDNGAEAAASS